MKSTKQSFFSFCLILFLCVSGCINTKIKDNTEKHIFLPVEYSKLFAISQYGNAQILYYIANKDTQKVTINSTITKPRIAVLSTVFAGFLEALQMQSSIVAVDNIKYYNDSIILNNFKLKNTIEIGEEGQLQIEKIIALKPDYLIVSTFGSSQKEEYKTLEKFGIKIIYCDNFKEQHPLARAEWLKFFGVITHRYQYSDSIFNIIANNYNQIKNSNIIPLKPKIMADAPFGDNWFVAGGNSFTAKLIEDAGGVYLFKHKTPLFSYSLHLEEVLQTAQNADIWIHTNQYKTKQELVNADKRYQLFKPYTINTIFNNNKQENNTGGNAFWEIGAARPDWILEDLKTIFNQPFTNKKLHFYQKVN